MRNARGKRLRLWHEYGGCRYCGKRLSFEETTLDHIVASKQGGKQNKYNLSLACSTCNARKSDRTNLNFRQLISGITGVYYVDEHNIVITSYTDGIVETKQRRKKNCKSDKHPSTNVEKAS